MKCYGITGWLIGWICLSASAGAERMLEAAETEALLQSLTAAPRQYWIDAGTLTVRHLEYRRANDYFAQSTETVVFDGHKFRWEITLDEEDAVEKTPSTAAARPVPKEPSPAVNRSRIFCWDGQRYTRYYPNAGYAVISGSTGVMPFQMPAALTEGIVPWGYGDFRLSELLARNPSASEITWEGRPCLQLRFRNEALSPALVNTLILDPDKQYAVLSFEMGNEAARIEHTYSDFVNLEGRWIPRLIRSERLVDKDGHWELLSYEDRQFTRIETDIPADSLFQVKVRHGTTVELYPEDGRKSLLYHASDQTDVSKILEQKLSFGSPTEQTPQNCATAAVRYLAGRFSRTIPKEKISALVAEDSGQTTLYDLKQNLEEAGLYCMAVQTNIDSLRALPSNCIAVVHLPGFRHYLIVDRVEDDAVWTIDLTSRRFYWKHNLREFVQDWSKGTALLVADVPTDLPIPMKTLDTMQLYKIQGGEYTTYTCSERIQDPYQITCPQPVGGFLCNGAFYIFFERYGCKEDENGGTCVGRPMNGYMVYNCVNDPYVQGNCETVNGRIVLMRACK